MYLSSAYQTPPNLSARTDTLTEEGKYLAELLGDRKDWEGLEEEYSIFSKVNQTVFSQQAGTEEVSTGMMIDIAVIGSIIGALIWLLKKIFGKSKEDDAVTSASLTLDDKTKTKVNKAISTIEKIEEPSIHPTATQLRLIIYPRDMTNCIALLEKMVELKRRLLKEVPKLFEEFSQMNKIMVSVQDYNALVKLLSWLRQNKVVEQLTTVDWFADTKQYYESSIVHDNAQGETLVHRAFSTNKIRLWDGSEITVSDAEKFLKLQEQDLSGDKETSHKLNEYRTNLNALKRDSQHFKKITAKELPEQMSQSNRNHVCRVLNQRGRKLIQGFIAFGALVKKQATITHGTKIVINRTRNELIKAIDQSKEELD